MNHFHLTREGIAGSPLLARAPAGAAYVRPRFQLARGLATAGDNVIAAADKGAYDRQNLALMPARLLSTLLRSCNIQ